MRKTYVISRSNMPDVTFDGKLLARVSSQSSPRAQQSKRWTELALYRSVGGKYVLVITGQSNRSGEIPLNTVHILDDQQEIITHLGFSRLAKSLYDALNLKVVEQL